MIYSGSRYSRTSLYFNEKKNSQMLGIRERPKFRKEDCITYTISIGEKLEDIAMVAYGNAQLDWVILDANPQYQSELEIKAGDKILIPKSEQVRTLI